MVLRKLSNFLLVLYAFVVTYTVLSLVLGSGYQPLLTPLATLLSFAFALDHGGQRLGWPRTWLLFGLTFAVSLLFESVGVATGWVYGPYHYTDALGYKFLGLVPLLIPVAWFAVSYPSFVIAGRLAPVVKSVLAWRLSVAGLGAVIMTAWDLAMDPMMVAGGYWVWEVEGAYFGIPLHNYAGWLLTIFVVFFLFLNLAKVTPENLAAVDRFFERQAILIYAILTLSTVAVNFQFDLDGPALVGLFAMAPWVVMGWRNPPRLTSTITAHEVASE